MRSLMRVFFCLLILIIGCKTAEVNMVKPDYMFNKRNDLEKTVHEYMNARMAGNKEGVYSLQLPEFQSQVNLEQYHISLQGESLRGLLSYRIESIQFENENTALVFISEYVNPGTIPTAILRPSSSYYWKNVDGKWYFDRFSTEAARPEVKNISGNFAHPHDPDKVNSQACGH